MSIARLLAPLAFATFATATMAQTPDSTSVPVAAETSLTQNNSYVGDTTDMARAAKENIEELLIQKDDKGFVSRVEWRDSRLCDEVINPDDCLDVNKTFRLNSTIATKRFWHKVNPLKFLDKRTAAEVSQAWLDAAQKLNGCEGVPYRWVF